MRVLVFGDSIAHGASTIDGGWVMKLQSHFKKIDIENKTDVMPDVYNLSISGDKTLDILKRFDNETNVRSVENEVAILFAIGINDTQINDGKPISDFDTFLENISKLTLIAKSYSNKIGFIGLTPVNELYSNPLEWAEPGFELIGFTNKRIKSFDKIIDTFCIKENIKYINVFDSFFEKMDTDGTSKKLLPDALHPSQKGHDLIFEILKNDLLNFLSNESV
jgi:lysophospholipase L1-like esterase